MSRRRLASILGVAVLGLGLVAMFDPELVAFAPGPLLVWGIGGLILLQALRVARDRWRSGPDRAVTADPELPAATPPPGEDVDAVLEGFIDTRGTAFHRGRAREGLRSVAAAVLTRYGTYSESEAEAALDAGRWTDDRSAAAFLGEANAPPRPLLARIGDRFRPETPMERAVRHTVDAIAAAAGLGLPPEGSPDDTSRHRDRGLTDAGRGGSPAEAPTPGDGGSDAGTDDVLSRASGPTGHWRGVSVVALVGIGAGLLVGEPAVLLAGVVGIGFAAYARSSVFPPGSVSIDRSLDADRPEPGEEVEVTVTVTNDSGRFLPDLRLVDGVPEALAVADGSPRLGTALRSGERTSFSYAVEARRGVHTFGRVQLVARDLPGSVEQERSVPAAATTLTCVPRLRPLTEALPLRQQATQYVGQVETSGGADGVEFYATREYRRGDPLSRIDWHRRARTGELTTVEFREERAAEVVLVIDATAGAYVSGVPYGPHALDRAVDAAGRIYASLTGSGDRVGIAALGAESCWLAPCSGADHAAEARELLATHPALSPVPGAGNRRSTTRWEWLRQRLPDGAQAVFLAPLGESFGDRFARELDAYGYPVTVVSPDPTADGTTGHRLARVARTLRVSGLRAAGIPVVDWPSDRTVDEAIARHNEGSGR